MPIHLRYFEASGSRHAIGLQLGEAMRDLVPLGIQQILEGEIPRNNREWIQKATPGARLWSRSEIIASAQRYIPMFKEYCPLLLEELHGIAEGAKLPFEEVLLLQTRSEAIFGLLTGCTAFALSRSATADGHTLAGQNWDYRIEPDFMVVLHLIPDDCPAQIMLTFPGLTSYVGLNAAGVCSFANAMPRLPYRVGMPLYAFWWRVFQQTSLDGVRKLCAQTTLAQAENQAFCDGSGEIGDCELTPEGPYWMDTSEGFVVHSNHFVNPAFAGRPEYPPLLADSVPRYARLHGLVKSAYGRLTVPMMQGFLSDHEGYPRSLCRHEPLPDRSTAASLIAEPERGVLHICAGNPCVGEYVAYHV